MTAPTVDAPELDGTEPLDRSETAPAERPEGTAPVRLVLAVEGIDTSDGRFINEGALSTRPMPLTIYAQVRSTHGLEGDAATFVVGAVTEAERVPGPDVMQRSTGQPFPDGTSVWMGRGWMYTDVPSPESGSKPAYTLMKDGALYGNSVDLSAVDAEFQYGTEDDATAGGPPERIVMHSGVISSTTIVGIPAFMDSFVEVDGEVVTASAAALEAVAATAERVPSWRSADVGDVCGPCAAGDSTDVEPLADLLTGEDLDPDALDFSTSGMVALIPANPQMLAVPNGDPAPDIHLTLAYLGDEVDQWSPEQAQAVRDIALRLTDFDAMIAFERADQDDDGTRPVGPEVTRDQASAAQRGPLEANIFSFAVFNPNGDGGFDPATVYLLDGTGDRPAVDNLQGDVCWRIKDELGELLFPDQHYPFVPHITAGYNVPIDMLTYTGPVVFDRLRVTLAGQTTEYPLGGGGAIVASAAPAAPLTWFQNPELDGPTALTVTDDGRVYGHLACWGTCHIGFQGQCVTPPRSASQYAYFTVHTTRAVDTDGTTVNVPVGYGTIGTGHADIRLNALAAAEHYDNTGTAAFELAIGEDDHGIWVAGRLMPGLDELTEHKARGTVFSGDWRTIRGSLELVASLGVNTPGFHVPRTRVASGMPLALVAAGMVTAGGPAELTAAGLTKRDLVDIRALAEWVEAQKLTADQAAALVELDTLTEGMDLETVQAALVADLLLSFDGDHPWFNAELTEYGDDDAVTAAGGKKLHLPPYIRRIEKHLEKKGMAKSRAIATAVNAAKKMCSSGDTSLPGVQSINAGSRAEACTAVAQWKKDRPGAK
jgi:hypothetical protein